MNPEDKKTLDLIHLNLENSLKKFPTTKDKKYIYNPATDNLTVQERKELERLKTNREIIIKSADKGGATVIMNTEDYIFEANRQLLDKKYYYPLSESIADINVLEIKKCLNSLKHQKFITQKQYDFLLPKKYKERVIYFLPKIHKPPAKWTIPNKMPPGRPIVSDVGSETYNIAKYIDHFINPLAQGHTSFIKNSYEFLQKIKNKNLQLENRQFFLVTGDITSLYTNMHITRSLTKVREIFQKNPDPTRNDEILLKLLEISLRGNDFLFNNQYYLQTMGTAMGKRFAPALANIYLLDFDEAAMNGFHIHPELFFRFLDDIFFIFFGTEEELKTYETFLNTLIPDIKIELEYSRTKVNFLDLTLFIEDQQIKHTVYHKPTDTHQLLEKSSYHPPHTFKGILKSQFIRFKRLCHNHEYYEKSCKSLIHSLKNRGYGIHAMKTLRNEIWNSYTEKTNNEETNPQPRDQNQQRQLFPLVGLFNEFNTKHLESVKNIIRSNHKLKDQKIIKAFKTNPNLAKILTKSKFPPD